MKKIKNKIKKISPKKIQSSSTKLFIIDKVSKIIKIKRIFFINSNKKDIRGNHGHKKCTQVFLSLRGVIKLEIFNGKKTKLFKLKPFSEILKVEPNNWVKVHFLKDQLLMVLCDRFFEQTDYIFDKNKIGKKSGN